jgi:Arc/MetJ-type ribon-helix-helix transcriptional regulator
MAKVVQVELPEKLVAEIEALVAGGWFADEEEVVRLALTEFISRHRFALLEQFQREDIAWALQQKREDAAS